MEGLDINNILELDEIENLFLEDTENTQTPGDSGDAGSIPADKNTDKKTEEPTEVDIENLFDNTPESVSSNKETIQNREDTDSKGVSSPNQNFYSSIAKALKEDGIFPDIEDSMIDETTDAEKFASIIETHISSKLEERQKRVDEALNSGMEISEVRRYEQAISYLDSISEEQISDEGDSGENIRKQLIYQDFINRGYSKERATREVNKSFDSGSDLEDAKEALSSNREFFNKEYSSIVDEHKKEEQRILKEREQQSAELKKSLLDSDKVFGDITIDKSTRQKIYDSISKPVYKDPDTGEYFTEIQKYEKENKTEFLKNIGILYALTNGFKDINNLVKPNVDKAIKSGIRDLETKITNTNRNSGGTLSYMGGNNEDSESFIKGNWDISL